MCAICGLDNLAGVRAPFYSTKDGGVAECSIMNENGDFWLPSL